MSKDRPLLEPNEERSKKYIRMLLKCHKQKEQLLGWMKELIPLGEPPYAISVFVGISTAKNESQEEIKKSLGIKEDFFYKCHLFFESGMQMVGSVSKKLGDTLQSGQLV